MRDATALENTKYTVGGTAEQLEKKLEESNSQGGFVEKVLYDSRIHMSSCLKES